MTKQEFDQIFVEQLPQLYEVIPKLISRYNRKHLEIDLVINETYLYCFNLIDEFDSRNKLISYIAKFINSNIYWTNSKINKTESISTIEFMDCFDLTDEDDEQDLNFKILLEDNHTKTIYVMQLYRNYLINTNKKVLLIVFDTIFTYNIYTGSKLSKHLNINKDSACKHLRILKEDIKLFKMNLQIK